MPGSWKAAFGILLVFGFGCISGALSTSIYYHQNPGLLTPKDPAAAADALERKLTRRLHLEPQQRQDIHQVLMDYLQQRKELQSRIQPDIQALNIQMIRQIRSELHPDQVATFHDNVADFRKRLARTAFQDSGPGNGSPASIGATNAPSTNSPVMP